MVKVQLITTRGARGEGKREQRNMQFRRIPPNLFLFCGFVFFLLFHLSGSQGNRRRDLNHSSSYSIIFGKNWLSSHVLTFISITTTTKLHTVHQWKVINLKTEKNNKKTTKKMCLTFLFWLLGIIDKIINIYKFSRAHFFFVLNLCFLKIIFDFPSSTGRPERKRHLDCLLVRRRK